MRKKTDVITDLLKLSNDDLRYLYRNFGGKNVFIEDDKEELAQIIYLHLETMKKEKDRLNNNRYITEYMEKKGEIENENN